MNKKNYEIVDSTEKLEKAIERVRQAQKKFADIIYSADEFYQI